MQKVMPRREAGPNRYRDAVPSLMFWPVLGLKTPQSVQERAASAA
jgi:hypothetical protein